jgi:predicted lipoprotein
MAAKPPEARLRPRRWVAPAVLGGAFAVLFVFYPPFRVVPLNAPSSTAKAVAFDATAYAATFWNDQLQPAALTEGTDLATLVRDLRADPDAARTAHARTVGIGGRAYYVARGSGRIVGRERSALLVEPEGAPGMRVALRTGPVFGNTVRDASGLLEVNEFPGLTEFNALAAALNSLVEERVLPALAADLPEGATIAFTGAVEVPGSLPTDPAAPLLAFTPLRAEVK